MRADNPPAPSTATCQYAHTIKLQLTRAVTAQRSALHRGPKTKCWGTILITSTIVSKSVEKAQHDCSTVRCCTRQPRHIDDMFQIWDTDTSTICDNSLRNALTWSDLDSFHNFFHNLWYGNKGKVQQYYLFSSTQQVTCIDSLRTGVRESVPAVQVSVPTPCVSNQSPASVISKRSSQCLHCRTCNLRHGVGTVQLLISANTNP